MKAGVIADEIRKKLLMLAQAGCEVDAALIKKQGNPDKLGISDTGENTERQERNIKIIPVMRGSDKNVLGEIENGMELGNNPDEYLEFIQLISSSEQVFIKTGGRIKYMGKEFLVYEAMPIVLGNELLMYQYTAKKVL